MLRTVSRSLIAALMLGGSVVALPASSQAQSAPDPENITYGTISGNAFDFFADTDGEGVAVVGFGPENVEEQYGIVVQNFTDAPVYGVNVDGTITGEDGETSASMGEFGAPYAIPTGGLSIGWGFTMDETEVGESAELVAEATFATDPRTEGAARLPAPVTDIQTSDEELTATVFNGYLVELFVPMLDLVCLDAAGNVTSGHGGLPDDEIYTVQPIPTGTEATYTFELDGACEYFLVAGEGLDDTSGETGTAPITNDAQFIAEPVGAGSTDADTSADAPEPLIPLGRDEEEAAPLVADCSPFGSFAEAQAYYQANPDAQAVLDPNLDGRACEVYFGVDAPVAQPAPAQPAPAAPQQPAAPAAPATNCDPSYPGLCLPSFPDLDCPEVGVVDFVVYQPDPHGFDGDGDGIGCES